MNVRPTRTFVYFLCFTVTSLLLNLSCNKEDEYALLDAVLNKEVTPENEENVSTQLSQTEDKEDEGIDIKEEIEGIDIREDFESRTTTFSPIHDAYLQNGRGYNQPIVRLQEDRRTSYLMFDLSQIDSIGGLITDARLEFVINQDDGNGKIQVFKGATNNWTETSLTETTAPEIGGTLGEIQQEYQVNRKIGIDLNAAEILPEYATLILNHYDGDDLAFASKENRNREGSRLIVTYQAPITSDVIVTDTEQDNDNGVGDEGNTEEDTTEEETAVEESTTEEGVEEDTKEEESTTEEGVEEDTKEEETTTEESVAEDATEEETTAEETTDEQVNEEGTTEEEDTTDETTEEETTTAETKEEDTEENNTTEDTSEEETTQEETTQEETTEEEGTNGGGAITEETTEDDTTSDETVEEETVDEEVNEEVPTEETTPDEETTQEETAEEETSEQETNEETPETNQPENPGPVSPANSAPITVAEATPSSGTVPLKVTFTGSNSSDDKAITRYAWNFKDGSTASTANTVHTFTEVGTYEVVLTTTDEEGLNSSKTITITVEEKSNAAPVAKASADKSSGTAPFEVSFKGGDSTDDNSVKSYSWDFKDGASSNEIDPSHTFTDPGTYGVELTVSDESGLTDKDTVTITVEEKSNAAPVAKASSDKISGTAPLEVRFTGGGSTDDISVKGYFWDFRDGASSTETDPSHTFSEPGTYQVELTVTDDKDLTDKATVTITVDEPANESPVAVAGASVLSGDAPLQVDFTGSDSSDDQGVMAYSWDFQGASSSSADVSHTFDSPGDYNIALTVTDGQGLQDTATLTVTVDQPPTVNTGGGQIPCSVGGGKADETGAKIWCWDNVNIPDFNAKSITFNDGQLGIDNECNVQVSNSGNNKLRFYVNPTNPAPQGWCNNSFNMRAELLTRPWQVDQPEGTEEWVGYTYTFGDNYAVNTSGTGKNWIITQNHEGTNGASPLLSLQIDDRSAGGFAYGELITTIASAPVGSNTLSHVGTGIVPTAGKTLKIVMHVIWGDENNGLWQVWVNDVLVRNTQGKTVRDADPVGGNWKFGIYSHAWRNQSGVNASAAAGVTEIETFLGPLRMITRRPGDPEYGKDSYSQVVPN